MNEEGQYSETGDRVSEEALRALGEFAGVV